MGITLKEIETRVSNFVRHSKHVACMLARQAGFPIAQGHIEIALVEVLGLQRSTDLLDIRWSEERMLSVLSNYDFSRFFPALLAEEAFEGTIIPPGATQRLDEQTIRRHGERWRIYRNDPDPFPSNPHAHNLESGHKLHLGSGDLFLGRRLVGRISRKDLAAIRARLTSFRLPTLI